MRAPGQEAKSEAANRRRRTSCFSSSRITLNWPSRNWMRESLPGCNTLYYDSAGRPERRPLHMSEARTILQAANAATSEPARERDRAFLCDFWYRAVRSTEITGNRLVTAMLLEVPLVLGRTTDSHAFAMRDSCPHRGMPLSYGHFDGQAVECTYHGWRFDACTAQCVEIPSLTSQDKLKVDRLAARPHPSHEPDRHVCVYMNAPGTRLPEKVAAAPPLSVFSKKYK